MLQAHGTCPQSSTPSNFHASCASIILKSADRARRIAMQDATGLSVQSIGAALISSDLGASELIVGLLVAMTFVAFAANSLIARHEGQAWSRRAAPPR